MRYSIEQMHKEKNGDRREGRTVDALVEAIGKIMVLKNERIPFIVRYMDRVRDKIPEFYRLCREHFDVEPISYSRDEYGIKGYSSRVVFMSADLYAENGWYRFNPEIVAVVDTD